MCVLVMTHSHCLNATSEPQRCLGIIKAALDSCCLRVRGRKKKHKGQQHAEKFSSMLGDLYDTATCLLNSKDTLKGASTCFLHWKGTIKGTVSYFIYPRGF